MFNRGERENEISFPTRIDSFRLFLKDLAIVSLCKSSRLGRKGKKKKGKRYVCKFVLTRSIKPPFSLFQTYVWIYITGKEEEFVSTMLIKEDSSSCN